MKLSQYLFVVFTLLSFFTASYAQETVSVEQALKQEEIEKQFDIVIKKSGRYQEYKVIKQVWINKLKANVNDSIKKLETKITTNNKQIEDQQATITGLEASLNKTNEDLALVTQQKDNMSFFGASVTKSSYKTIMWIIVGALLALLGFFIYKFKNSNAVTIQAKKALAETEDEFEDHRRRSLEREQKVMRKLQDEINKQRKAGAK
ncbi:tRNA (guanine-N1)-methyltransferase [Aquimarina sp. U1-2]|uniref:tRNA (guanine-N1)-methyltransferase n=1 Tax=Aquimarina sp. U1-2 TaxID=2823141 RepID=UPI001AECE89C|nr:tRNA (guanine-N1)-methyltransferase [Aquimarina sp. U1-2]MBP2833933.1 tRNA (guanine-N1)-methyltransferase [Aquimarina sp. U1-2]